MVVNSCGSGTGPTAVPGRMPAAGAVVCCVTTAPFVVTAAAATDFCIEFSVAKATMRDSCGAVGGMANENCD